MQDKIRGSIAGLLIGVTAIFSAASLGGGCASIRDTDGVRKASTFTAAKPKRLPFPGVRSDINASNMTAHVVSYHDFRDPLIYFNRTMFFINDKTYRYLLIPVSRGYTWLMPDAVENSIDNLFYNIKTPIYAVNNLLQWNPADCWSNVSRFGINSTIGILGLFDPAKSWFGIERRETHLEDTLSEYGLGYGIYIVLPVLGPSDLRNGLSAVGDYFLNPIPYALKDPASTSVQGFDYLQDFAPGAEDYNTLRLKSEDPYLFYRNLYLQGVQRDAAYR